MSQPYTNSEGLTLGGCQYCGHCERAGCEANAKAGPHVCVLPVLRADPKFELRPRSWVSRLTYDKNAKKVTGVVYTDTRTGEEYEQPAGLVVLSAYVFGNISLLLHSGIGEPYDPATQKGAVGRNYCYQLSRIGLTMFFNDKNFNPFMGSPGSMMVIDDFDGDNFDHAGSASSAAAASRPATARAGRSTTGRRRRARRAGARPGRRPRSTTTSTR